MKRCARSLPARDVFWAEKKSDTKVNICGKKSGVSCMMALVVKSYQFMFNKPSGTRLKRSTSVEISCLEAVHNWPSAMRWKTNGSLQAAVGGRHTARPLAGPGPAASRVRVTSTLGTSRLKKKKHTASNTASCNDIKTSSSGASERTCDVHVCGPRGAGRRPIRRRGRGGRRLGFPEAPRKRRKRVKKHTRRR
jgi:hypothetical protein